MNRHKNMGWKTIVIADHDTWEAVHEAKEQARRTGILTIPALELSCIDENRMVHILGYGIETEKEHSLSRLIEKIQKSRIDILPKIKRNLEEEGFYVDMTQVEKLAYPHPPVITNFANAILQDPRNDGDPDYPYTDRAGVKQTNLISVLSKTIWLQKMLCSRIYRGYLHRDTSNPGSGRYSGTCPSGRMVYKKMNASCRQ